MELKYLMKNSQIIGLFSNYQSNLGKFNKVTDLNIPNLDKALIMVGLDESYKNNSYDELTISELWKIELATKLRNDVIIVGNMSKCLIFKDREYVRKLLLKLNKEYNKKIVVIDEDVNSFINLVDYIYVLKDKKIIYETNNLFDNELYLYTKMPKIIEFINYVNNNKKKKLDNTLDIHELIKDIYRRVNYEVYDGN